MNRAIEQLNLIRYLPFCVSCGNEDYALVLYNKFGTQQKAEFSDINGRIKKILPQANNQNFNWDNVSISNNVHLIDDNVWLQVVPVRLGANERCYWLALLQVASISSCEQQKIHNGNILSHIAECIQEDYTQIEVINGMSEELIIRYEELNLLYGMDDSDSFYQNRDENASLTQIINNCTDYLNIDLALMYFPDMEVSLFETDCQQVENHELLVKSVYETIYPFILEQQETVVINRDSDTDWTDAGLKIPYKLIVSPILKSDQQLSGILVLINGMDKLDFSNSDRKLAEIMAAEASKLTQARRDSITGQLNRRGFTEKLDGILSQKEERSSNVLLLVNLDRFKVVNDTSGQAGGDQLLRQINSLIQKNLKNNDVLSRLGADEFAIILRQCDLNDGMIIAERIRTVIKQFRFFYQEKLFDISGCVGVVDLDESIDNFSMALRAADLACSVAKEEGRNRIHVYKKDDEELVLHENQMQWVSRINIGLEENRFQLFRQKIQPLQTSNEELPHYEILLRLKDKDGAIISPFHFIPAAERYNLMSKLDRWVVATTLKKMAETNKNDPKNSFSCSINLSGQSFCEEKFSSYVIEQIQKYAVPAQHLCFEITETAAVSNFTKALDFIDSIKKLGCQFSLDDFGSGMSSFTYLKNLPVDYLKIDGYFVKTLLENEIDKAMVTSIHQVGSVMGLKTIAEFVENEAILKELTRMGVDYGQGYGIGKPEPF
jgi:diguanylate cyclase (GGDEF)-like protein